MRAKFPMNCPHCNASIQLNKSLKRGKSRYPEECPECGTELEKTSPTTLSK